MNMTFDLKKGTENDYKLTITGMTLGKFFATLRALEEYKDKSLAANDMFCLFRNTLYTHNPKEYDMYFKLKK